MIDKMSTYILDNFLYKEEKVTGDQREIMLFGVIRILEDIPKYTAIIIICILLNIIKEAAIVLAVSLLYKSFVGGAHARTNIGCFVISALYFITPVLLAKYIPINKIILGILLIITLTYSIYVIIKRVPADTEEIPILNKDKKKLFKILAFISLAMIYIAIYFINNHIFSIIIVTSLIYINMTTSNFMYKALRCKHSYESKEFQEYSQQDI